MLLTILTASYNRGYLLKDLYSSLKRQTLKDFVWYIIDDGSIDNTKSLVDKWKTESIGMFPIIYQRCQNGGKNRAINRAVDNIQTEFVMIVDSDDYLVDDAIEFVIPKLKEINGEPNIAGISGLSVQEYAKGSHELEDSVLTINNLQRAAYGLQADACEIYKTDLLRSHPFFVWEGEKFTPEEIVWDTIALEGYCLRWYKRPFVIVRYQDDGLTKDSFSLIKKNPMGYAMLFNHRLRVERKVKTLIKSSYLMTAYSILGKSPFYLLQSNRPFYTIFTFPIGCVVAIRRLLQYRKIH